MYEDLSLRQKQEEVKIKAVDALKAKQMERLGMGFTGRRFVSIVPPFTQFPSRMKLGLPLVAASVHV